MVLYGTWVKGRLVSVYLEIVLISMQDRFMVCSKCTTGLEMILGTPNGTPTCCGQVEAKFSPFGDSVNLEAS